MKGYKKVLLGKEITPTDDDEEVNTNTPAGREKQRLREANEMAYTDLVLSINGESASGRVAFNLVRLSKTKEHTEGDARLAWAKLKNKYATKSAPSLLALKKELTNSHLEKGENDPDVWIGKLEDLRIQLEEQGSTMSDMDLMVHILNNLPESYEISVAKLEDRLNNDNDPLTLEEIRTDTLSVNTFENTSARIEAPQHNSQRIITNILQKYSEYSPGKKIMLLAIVSFVSAAALSLLAAVSLWTAANSLIIVGFSFFVGNYLYNRLQYWLDPSSVVSRNLEILGLELTRQSQEISTALISTAELAMDELTVAADESINALRQIGVTNDDLSTLSIKITQESNEMRNRMGLMQSVAELTQEELIGLIVSLKKENEE